MFTEPKKMLNDSSRSDSLSSSEFERITDNPTLEIFGKITKLEQTIKIKEEEHAQEIEKLNSNFENVKEELQKEYQKNIEEVSELYSKAHEKLEISEEKIEELQNIAFEVRNENKELKEKLDKKEADIHKLEEAITVHTESIQQKQLENSRLNEELKSSKDEVAFTNRNLFTVNGMMNDLSNSFTEHKRKADVDIANRDNEIKRLNTKLATYKNKCNELVNDKNTLKLEKENIINTYKREMNIKVRSIDELTSQKQNISQENDSLSQRLLTVSQELEREKNKQTQQLPAPQSQSPIDTVRFNEEKKKVEEYFGIYRNPKPMPPHLKNLF